MKTPPLVYVGSGELCIGRGSEVLAALLGSCVAIAIVWEEGRCCGLAHCLLPRAPDGNWKMSARYVDQAVPSLLAMMGVRQKDRAALRVMLAGGARMLGGAGVSSDVGTLNIAAAHERLAEYGLTAQRAEVGGRRGRKVRLDCATGLFAVERVDPHHGDAGGAEPHQEEQVHASL